LKGTCMTQQSTTYRRVSPLQGEANHYLALKDYSTKTRTTPTPSIEPEHRLNVSTQTISLGCYTQRHPWLKGFGPRLLMPSRWSRRHLYIIRQHYTEYGARAYGKHHGSIKLPDKIIAAHRESEGQTDWTSAPRGSKSISLRGSFLQAPQSIQGTKLDHDAKRFIDSSSIYLSFEY
jgi:hypothetical protein